LRVIAEMGGEYPDAAELLRQVERNKCLSCAVVVDALPSAASDLLLAAAGQNAEKFKDMPDLQREVVAAQRELGIVPSATGGRSSGGAGPAGHGAGTK
jgi:hypothetical protein